MHFSNGSSPHPSSSSSAAWVGSNRSLPWKKNTTTSPYLVKAGDARSELQSSTLGTTLQVLGLGQGTWGLRVGLGDYPWSFWRLDKGTLGLGCISHSWYPIFLWFIWLHYVSLQPSPRVNTSSLPTSQCLKALKWIGHWPTHEKSLEFLSFCSATL